MRHEGQANKSTKRTHTIFAFPNMCCIFILYRIKRFILFDFIFLNNSTNTHLKPLHIDGYTYVREVR